MYLVSTKTSITESLRSIFDNSYPETDFRNVNVTLDFPLKPQDYPGVWIQFEDTQDMERAGIDHREIVVDDDGITHQVTRYRFGGTFHFTCSALSSLERDRLFDEIVRVLAFSGIDESPAGRFKTLVEANDLIGINLNYDVLTPSGDAATPGTPWDTNEVIYEKTISIQMIGEFVSDISTSTLYRLSKVLVKGYTEDGENPSFPDPTLPPDLHWDPSQWS